MRTVLITGGAGYIGSHTVCELDKAGVATVVLDNLTTGHREAVNSRYFYRGDIADHVLVDQIIREHRIKSVIHFAARSRVSESLSNPELYFDENTVKSFIFFQAAMKAGVKQIVFSSSAAVYGIPDSLPVPENAGLAPINPYGASKRMIEEYLQWMGKVHGVRWVALRYFNAAGAALDGSIGEDHRPETHLVPLVLQTVLGVRKSLSVYGTDYPTPDGTCIRDYIHVVDLARAHILALRALEDGLAGQTFNVGTGQGYSVLEIIDQAEKISGIPLKREYEKRRTGDPPVLVADSRAIKEALGWQPHYSDLKTILSSAWGWHRHHPRGYGSYPEGFTPPREIQDQEQLPIM